MRRYASWNVLDVLRDVMLGGRHSRRTIARLGLSLPTADRWIRRLTKTIPGARTVRVSKTTWLEWRWAAGAQVVHVLHEGQAICGLGGVPRDWPKGHTWVRIGEGAQATCSGCQMVFRRARGWRPLKRRNR
jgi:hypothetical protein